MRSLVRITIAAVICFIVQGRLANAQPAATAPTPTLQLDAEDAAILERGEISDREWVGGGVVAWLFGFGAGQAMQGRWLERGWIFTLAEPVAAGAVLYAWYRSSDGFPFYRDQTASCGSQCDWMFFGGLAALAGLRTWEVVDAFAVPPAHNRRVRKLQARIAPGSFAVQPYLAPLRAHGRDATVAGVSIAF
jgi:hypothetical protein